MLISYMRSSSYSNFDFCEMQYFMNYVLGIPRTTSKKAALGTSVHKVLECLAKIKGQFDRSADKDISFYDKEFDVAIEINRDELLQPYTLTNAEVDAINKTRINKQTYKHECQLSYGHTRYGVKLVEALIKLSSDHYSENWMPVDFKDMTNFVWMALDHNGGLFDPRRRMIVAAEPHFDFIIDKEWAKYNWTLPNGKKLSGKLGIKGTIDLITRASEGIIEIVDWKTGQRLDWGSQEDNKVKTYADLCQDFQLMLYYYAAKRMYPQVKQIIVTIFFIRDGGPFTVCFDDKTLEQVETKLRDRFNKIRDCVEPTMQDPNQLNFKCKYICDYFKMPSPDGKTNLCKYLNEQLPLVGIEEITNKYTNKGFSVGHYEAPGEA